MSLSYENDSAFMEMLEPVITHPAYERQKYLKHHHSSIYEHSLDVAWVSYKIAVSLGLRMQETVRGALLHDFFLYDRRDKSQAVKFHFINHPEVAYRNAQKYFGYLTRCESDIIRYHMWPVAYGFPRFPETYIVATVDKLLAFAEFTQEAASRLAAQWVEGGKTASE